MSEESEAFILNELRNPKIIPSLYFYLSKASAHTIGDIAEATSFSPNLIEEGISAMQFFGLLEKQHDVYKVIQPDSKKVQRYGTLNALKIEMLGVLSRKAKKAKAWTKQAAFRLILEYVLFMNTRIVDPDQVELPALLDDWFTAKGYHPKSSDGQHIRMNSQKLLNWSRLAAFLDLLMPIGGNECLLFIQPQLVLRLILLFKDEQKGSDFGLIPFLIWMDDNYLPVPAFGPNSPVSEVPYPYVRILVDLHVKGAIKLQNYGDHGHLIFRERPRIDGLEEKYNAFRV